MKDITIDIFDPSSISKAITLLKKYQSEIETNLSDSLEIVGKEAQEFCKPFFINYDKNEGRDAVLGVELEKYKDVPGFAVTAVGKGVGFLEFGAGLTADPGHPLAKNAPFPVGMWEYSKDHAQQGYRNGYWYWGGKKWTHKPDQLRFSRGLYNTTNWIRENAKDIIKRSWKK